MATLPTSLRRSSPATSTPTHAASAANNAPLGLPATARLTASAADAHATFLPLARALDAASVVPFRGAMPLVYRNVERGARALLEHRAAITRDLPTIDIEHIASLPRLALALEHAILLADQAGATPGDVRKLVAEATPLRGFLLASADALARIGVVPMTDVKRIRAGHGHVDTARDLLALADLFELHADAIGARTAVTAEHLRDARARGAALLARLRPSGARADAPSAEAAAAVDVRDRLWTLLVQRVDRARCVAAFLWGYDAADAHVPRPLAHEYGGRPRRSERPAPAPVPAPAPTPA